MRRIFGLDIGTTSIGWAGIEHDPATFEGNILGMGVRVFPEARDPEGTPLNQTRRMKRLARRTLRRRRQRRRALNELLADAGLLPPFSKDKASAWAELMKTEPLTLRSKGVAPKDGTADRLTPHELGRALYHLARLRHFKGRELAETEEEPGETPDEKKAGEARQQTIQALKASGQTLGQMLAGRGAPKGEVPRQQTRRIHALRSHVESEFNRLIQSQEAYHPILRDPKFAARLHTTIFAQKPVFWRKNTLGHCRFLPEAPLCPRGSWLSQQRRMLEKLNNLTVVGGNFRPLDKEERAAILARLGSQASMSWSGVRSALKPLYKRRGEPGAEKALRFNLELGGEPKLLGNAVEAKLAAVFGNDWMSLPHRDAIRYEVQERLWRADYDEIGQQRVVIRPESDRRERREEAARDFVRDFGITEAQAKSLSDLQLPAGWEPYSTEALSLFLPKLEEGVRFGALVAGPEWEEWREASFPDRERPTGEILDRLPSPADPEEQKRLGTIRNPTVVRVQNELRKGVNNLLRVYGKPHLIRVELAREVGLSKSQREEMRNALRQQEQRRRTAADDLRSKGIDQPSRAVIEKWMLWKEGLERCPYTGDQIGFDALFRNGEYEIEHIWPRSRSLDDSFRNKTLCRRDVNGQKGNRTPFEYFRSNPDEWDAVVKRLQSMVARKGSPGVPVSKFKRFTAEVIPEDFTNRQLTDTGYAARQAVSFLKRLWPDLGPEAPVNVEAVSGRVTGQLRRFWELNNILSEDGEKTRADHRHHAIDALVVACTDLGTTNRLSRYWQQREDPRAERPRLPPPWPGIRRDAERAVEGILVSHRVRKKVSGPLHAEMPFGDTGEEVEKNGVRQRVFVKKMPVGKLSSTTLEIGSPSEISRTAKFVVRDKAVREALKRHLDHAGGDPKKAYVSYPSVSGAGPEIRKVRTLSLQQSRLMAPVSVKREGSGEGGPTGFADLANNHHLAIRRLSDGSVGFEIVSLFEAARRLAKREPVIRRRFGDGASFVMSLAPGEAVEFLDGPREGVWIVQGAWANGQVVLTRHTDARPTSKGEAESLGMDGVRQEFRPAASTLVSDAVRKVSIDPIGRVRPASD